MFRERERGGEKEKRQGRERRREREKERRQENRKEGKKERLIKLKRSFVIVITEHRMCCPWLGKILVWKI